VTGLAKREKKGWPSDWALPSAGAQRGESQKNREVTGDHGPLSALGQFPGGGGGIVFQARSNQFLSYRLRWGGAAVSGGHKVSRP